MEIILYKMNEHENTINKNMEEVERYDIKMIDDFNIYEPIVTLKIDYHTLKECNYCYITDIERYYFIRDIEPMSGKLFTLFFECDVLETYKNEILTGNGTVERKIKEGDYQNVSIDSELKKEIEIYQSDTELETTNKMILSTMSGGI